MRMAVPGKVRTLLQPLARPTLLSGREGPDDVLLTPLTARQLRAIQDYLGVEYAYKRPEWPQDPAEPVLLHLGVSRTRGSRLVGHNTPVHADPAEEVRYWVEKMYPAEDHSMLEWVLTHAQLTYLQQDHEWWVMAQFNPEEAAVFVAEFGRDWEAGPDWFRGDQKLTDHQVEEYLGGSTQD